VIKRRKNPVKIQRRTVVLLGLCLAALAAAGLAGRGEGNKATPAAGGPDSRTQPLLDGCTRKRGDILTKDAPNWVYVGGTLEAQNKVFAGVVDSQYQPERAAEPTGTDNPFTHTSYDFVFNVKPDPEYENVLGTGNFEGQSSETARLHNERESATFPMWAWPDRGDRVTLIGSWVWDCDHTSAAGEHTEIHPFRTLWVERNPGGSSPRSPAGDREADLFVTTAGTAADRQAVCGLRYKGDASGFKSCVTYDGFAVPRVPVEGGSFVLKAGAKPSRSARLYYRVVDRGSDVPVSIRKVVGGVEVSYPRTDGGTIAKQIFVGWRPVRKPPVHLRVHFDSLLVRRAMDPGCPPYNRNCPDKDESILLGQVTTLPGEWNVYVDAAGVWRQWLPQVLKVQDGQTIRSKQKVDLYLPRGKSWRLFVQTRECDFGSLGNAYSVQGTVAPCPRVLEVGNTASDDQPGIAVFHFPSPEKSLGRHSVNSSLDGSTCPASNTKGCYRVTFTITRIRP
jgi:hypothetical protein